MEVDVVESSFEEGVLVFPVVELLMLDCVELYSLEEEEEREDVFWLQPKSIAAVIRKTNCFFFFMMYSSLGESIFHHYILICSDLELFRIFFIKRREEKAVIAHSLIRG